MARKAKKGSSRYYFTDKTEKAILRYNKEERAYMKNRIYNDHIKQAFEKLCENIIHTFKFYYFDVTSEQVKHDVVGFLVMNIDKYESDKGRAFSYFSVVAKNWLILNNNRNYKMYKLHTSTDSVKYADKMNESSIDKENSESMVLFFQEMTEWLDDNLTTLFRRDKDIRVADAVLYLMKNNQNIENFNKKALYILIREMTGSNTQHITRVINHLNKKYIQLSQNYAKFGTLDDNTKRFIP